MLSVVLLLLVFITRNTRWLLNGISYSSRPLWDSLDGTVPSVQIPHYRTEGLSVDDAEACQRHGWTKLEKKRAVVDATIFSVELELLEIRMAELWDYVDAFVVLESGTTFTGLPKNYTFAENRHLFAKFASKIHYHHINGRGMKPGEHPFAIEVEQRRAMTDFLSTIPALTPGALLLMSDVDEIPSPSTLSLLRACDAPLPIHLDLRSYVYSFGFPTGTLSWRAQVHEWDPARTGYVHSLATDRILLDAGWHCSFCFARVSDYAFKMAAYSHADRLYASAGWRSLLDPDAIKRKVCKGQDVFDMIPEAYTWSELARRWAGEQETKSVAGLPATVLRDPEKFAWLLPGGCEKLIL
ncbi:glycosyltransferase family 17 protein [Gonapodya prolifera JEL478]|uniref:Glycosyltransferase family 17 protein n=1 Tax=Gonapodya prolifera (strain JEL478) TaxID=1344416 RepID=A0A139ADU8_GONPJ|nr:glycosyltransferase family 17 protein [Gonapodya prolifera JEL478]|eukprot:KXS14839.1 glycosyltransferase family 17 protein [Gonapodya prolifera JEL478]